MNWFNYLVGNNKYSLFSFISYEELLNNFVICKEINNIRKYTYFNDLLELFSFIKNEKNSLHEVIIENKIQKFRLDIDIDLTNINNEYYDNTWCIKKEKKFLKTILNTLDLTLNLYQKNLNVNDISLFESHGNYKRSYHIVLHKYCFLDHLQIKQFYNQFINFFENTTFFNWMKYIDHCIYNKNQHFRLLGSVKNGTKRLKKPVKSFKWNKKFINSSDNELQNFKNSLITYIDESELIILKEKEKIYDKIELDENLYNEIIKLFKNKKDFNCYEIKYYKNNCISLQRLKPSYCNICERIHENENPYLFISNNNVYFSCRRTEEKEFLGTIKLNCEHILHCPKKNERQSCSKTQAKNNDLPILNMGILGLKIGNNKKGYKIIKKESYKRKKPKKITPKIDYFFMKR